MVVPATITVTFWALALEGFAPEDAANEVASPSTTPWTATPPLPEGEEGLLPPQAGAMTAAATATDANRIRRYMATSGISMARVAAARGIALCVASPCELRHRLVDMAVWLST
jgi:hypothetical protein